MCVHASGEEEESAKGVGLVVHDTAEDIADVSAEPNISRDSRIDWGGWRVCLGFLVCLRWLYCWVLSSEELLLIKIQVY